MALYRISIRLPHGRLRTVSCSTLRRRLSLTLTPSRVRAPLYKRKKGEKWCFTPLLSFWWSIGGSNPWPFDCQSNALPAAPMPRSFFYFTTAWLLLQDFAENLQSENSWKIVKIRVQHLCFAIFLLSFSCSFLPLRFRVLTLRCKKFRI